MSTLMTQYKKTIIPALQKDFGIANIMAMPKIEKVVLNVGIGRAVKDAKIVDRIVKDMTILSGQKPVMRKARKSLASFKLREGMDIGVMVTLRGKRMYDFIERLIHIALPRSRDFRGIELKNIDRSGNLNLGIKEHSIFPEIEYENLKDIFSLQATVVTNTENRDQSIELLRMIGFPLKK